MELLDDHIAVISLAFCQRMCYLQPPHDQFFSGGNLTKVNLDTYWQNYLSVYVTSLPLEWVFTYVIQVTTQ